MAASRRTADTLVPLLLTLTFASGVLDAFAFLHLGQLFVANQTGNVMLLAISLPASGSTTSTGGSIVSLAAFLLGALGGGRLTRAAVDDRGLPPGAISALTLETVLVAAALAASVADTESAVYAVTALLGYGLGIQAAVARRVARTGISTVVLTSAITGFAEEAPGASGKPGWWRHGLPVLAMFVGAVVGAAVGTQVSHHAALAIGLVAILAVTVVAWRGA
jgi:uncharacterized membrane protein YoaK (UPF0700 family)